MILKGDNEYIEGRDTGTLHPEGLSVNAFYDYDLNIIYNNDNSTKITTLFTDYIEYCECNKTRYYSGEYEKINSNDLKIILNSLLKLFFLSPHITNRYINKNYKTEKEYNHFRNFIRFIYTNMNKPNQYIFYLMEKFPDYKLYKAKKFNL
jgi:hypothetical protein